MKITKIQAQVKRPGRYSIYIDDEFAFGLSDIALLSGGLHTGQELTANQVSALKQSSKTDKIYNQTLGLLARRPRSVWEIQDYLKRKDVERTTANAIVERLEQSGLLDDLDFARRWIENRRLLKPISKRKLSLELRAKRVSGEVIENALLKDGVSDYDSLVDAVQKKRRQSKYQDDTKLMQYLARQGYGYDDIKRALANGAN